MFKNRAMQVKLVKDPKPQHSSTTTSHVEIDFNQIHKILLEQTRNVAVLAVGAAITLKLCDAACETAIYVITKK